MAHACVLVLLLIVGPAGVTASTHTVIDGTAAPSIRFDGIGGLSGVSCHSACVCLSLCVHRQLVLHALDSVTSPLNTFHLSVNCTLRADVNIRKIQTMVGKTLFQTAVMSALHLMRGNKQEERCTALGVCRALISSDRLSPLAAAIVNRAARQARSWMRTRVLRGVPFLTGCSSRATPCHSRF